MTRSGSQPHLSRRTALRLGAASALATGFAAPGPSWIGTARAQCPTLAEELALEGECLVDEATRASVAADFGRAISRLPLAVVRPRSANDVARVVSHAYNTGLKVTMRGQAHSLSGQALVDGGIVIDSRWLSDVRLRADDTFDAQPGALWGEVAKTTLEHERIPAVMPDAMMLSVGGTLSVGGIGETSYRFGAQVDQVLELDVVTGVGDLVTCSAQREPELFAMTLAGLGQCGLIVRARLRLSHATKFVATRTLAYDDLDAFLSDQALLAGHASLGPLNGRLIRTQGRWQFALSAGSFVAREDEGGTEPEWMSGLRHRDASAAAAVPIWSYLDRRGASITAGKVALQPNASLVVTLPAASTASFVRKVLDAPELSAGIWFFEISPKVPARHRQPLQKMPASELAYELRMQRRPSAANAPDHHAMLAANRTLVAIAMESGGKIYPPFAPILSPAQWAEHYGDATWRRFIAAKRRFDPAGALTPGAGIF